jgi:hypothetical protein
VCFFKGLLKTIRTFVINKNSLNNDSPGLERFSLTPEAFCPLEWILVHGNNYGNNPKK